jgi:hypothetical protein
MKKFERTNICIETPEGETLCRIRALKDINDTTIIASEGDLGGWINIDEDVAILNQNDSSWIGEDVQFISGVIYNDSIITCPGIYRNCTINSSEINGNGYISSASNFIRLNLTHATLQNNGILNLFDSDDSINMIDICGNVYIHVDSLVEMFGRVIIGKNLYDPTDPRGYYNISTEFSGKSILTNGTIINALTSTFKNYAKEVSSENKGTNS